MPDRVVGRLNKVLYGLRQSLLAFSPAFDAKLLGFGLERCAIDPRVIHRVSPGTGGESDCGS